MSPTSETNTTNPGASRKTTALIVGAAIALVAVLAIIAILKGHNNGSSTAESSSPAAVEAAAITIEGNNLRAQSFDSAVRRAGLGIRARA